MLDEPFDAGTASTPHGMAWCGPDSIVLHWRSVGLLMVRAWDVCFFSFLQGEKMVGKREETDA